jgi:heme-degrading monooxygenase HmoA
MVTIVTDVRLKEGSEQDWDAAMRERMAAAKRQPGWVGGQMLEPEDDPSRRVIVGTWQTRDDWEKWHEDPEFAGTREELEGLVMEPEEHEWHEVVLDVRKTAARPAASQQERKPVSRRKAG